MTDRELLQQWIKPYAIVPVTMDTTRILVNGLKEILANQKKEWVGLTGEELQEIYQGGGTVHFKLAMAEEKLKEKNT